jgi:hypothetical protein
MSKFTDFETVPEAEEIHQKMVDKFPDVFKGVRTELIKFIGTRGKKTKLPVKPHPVKYPMSVYIDATYVYEVNLNLWHKLSRHKKNLAIFRTMCMIPSEGFVPESDDYAKILKPQIQMFINEMALYGGVPGFPGSDISRDPEHLEQADIAAGINVYDQEVDVFTAGEEDPSSVSRIPVSIEEVIRDV